MAKITIPNITGSFASVTQINAFFQQLEDELNDKVLYRVNPTGEPNSLSNDIDMNSNDILNGNAGSFVTLSIDGTQVTASTVVTSPAASQVSNVPAGNIVATNVQDAINELDVQTTVWFDTTVTMKTASIAADQIVGTRGFSAKGDDGSAKYLVKTSADFGGTPDELRDFVLANGNVATNLGIEQHFISAGINRSSSDNNVTGGFIIGGEATGNGTILKGGGNPAWPKVKPITKDSPQQLQIYSNAIQGVAFPSAANVITRVFGDDLLLDIIRVGDTFYWNNVAYEVDAKLTTTTIQLRLVGGGSPGFTIDATDKQPFYHVHEITTSIGDITAGGAITHKSGDVFSPSPTSSIIVDGTQFAVATVLTDTTATVTSYTGGAKTGVTIIFKNTPSAPYITLFRLQALFGLSEETFAAYVTPDGFTILENQFAGDGSYHPIIMRTGERDDWFTETSDVSSSRVAFAINPTGDIAFGGGFAGHDNIHRTVIKRDEKTTVAMAIGGSVKSSLLGLETHFHVDDTRRRISVGQFNDFTAGFFQGEDAGGTASAIQVQPTELAGSQLFVGKHNNFSIDAKMVVGDPVAATPAHGAAIAPAQNNKYTLGNAALSFSAVHVNGAIWFSGMGTPEAAVTAPVGSIFTRTDGGAATSFYVKESGTGNTGWIAK